ncbi:MAG: hypothetical protein NTW86_29480 [Candidatus Sumerlaeota bacterium]|nr:hypothetical protein [Candidatus Sumerlaeota bacterium]
MKTTMQRQRWLSLGLILLGIGALAVSVAESLVGLPGGGIVHAVESASTTEREKASAPAASAPWKQNAGDNAQANSEENGQDTAQAALALSPTALETARSRDLLASLEARDTALDAREAAIAKETEQLNFLRADVEKRIADLRTLQTEIQEMLARADTQRKREMKNLIDVYKTMKSETVVKVLQEMDEPMALDILAGMDAATTSKILAGIADQNPKKAVDLSRRLVAIPGSRPAAK